MDDNKNPRMKEHQENGRTVMQYDHVAFGSDEHMRLLGLRRVEKDEKVEHAYKGYTVVDPTQWGPLARPEFIQERLMQLVNELLNPPKVPENAPPMWRPDTLPE